MKIRFRTAVSAASATATKSTAPLPLPFLAAHSYTTPEYCKQMMKKLELREIAPKIFAGSHAVLPPRGFLLPRLGDLVEVTYQLSKSKGTTARFQGYCIERKKKILSSGFRLKNVFDGIGVEQFFPIHSPRVLNVKIVKKRPDEAADVSTLPVTRNYRYQWHTFIRHRHSEGKRVHWRLLRQNVGIQSLEPRIRQNLMIIRRRYQMQRIEAGLPRYVWPGPYHITNRQDRQLVAEQNRRMLVYAFDERRQRALKRAKLHAKSKWTYSEPHKNKDKSKPLPRFHPLADGNLPK